MFWWKFDWVLTVRNYLLYITGGNLRDSSRQSCLVYVFLLIRHSTRVSSNSSRILLLDNLRIHGKSTLHSETRSLPPFPLAFFSCIRITMNIIFGVSLLVLIINCVAAAPGPLTVSEAKPDTFVVARIPGPSDFVNSPHAYSWNTIRGYGPRRGWWRRMQRSNGHQMYPERCQWSWKIKWKWEQGKQIFSTQ